MMIQATRDYLRKCYECTGEEVFALGVTQRVYDALIDEFESKSYKFGARGPRMYLDDTLIYVARHPTS